MFVPLIKKKMLVFPKHYEINSLFPCLLSLKPLIMPCHPKRHTVLSLIAIN